MKYLSKIYSEERKPVTNYPNELAAHLIKKIKKNSGKLIDVGCGRGDQLRAFSKLGFDVKGIDISDEAGELCNPFQVYKINLDNEDPVKILGEEKFDVVFSKSLIEHLKNPINFLNNCKKLLKDDGILIIMTPSWYHHKFGPFYLDFTHCTPFTLQSLRDVGEMCEFQSVKVNYFYQLPILWKYSIVKVICLAIQLFKLPYYPMYEQLFNIRWPDNFNKFVKFSREVMLIAYMRK